MSTTVTFDTNLSLSKSIYHGEHGVREFFLDIIQSSNGEYLEDIILGSFIKKQVDNGKYPIVSQKETNDFFSHLSEIAE